MSEPSTMSRDEIYSVLNRIEQRISAVLEGMEEVDPRATFAPEQLAGFGTALQGLGTTYSALRSAAGLS